MAQAARGDRLTPARELTFAGETMRPTAIAILVCALSAGGAKAATIYTQPFQPIYRTLWSQYAPDSPSVEALTANATAYDDFVLKSAATIGGVAWTGAYGYIGRPEFGPAITSFDVAFYADDDDAPYEDGGAPGALLADFKIAGYAHQSYLTHHDGYPFYTYEAPVDFVAAADTRYWLSIVPTVTTAPQYPEWGWAWGIGGDSDCADSLLGLSFYSCSLAFTLTTPPSIGIHSVPEPSSWALLLAGFAGLGYAARRTVRRTPVGA